MGGSPIGDTWTGYPQSIETRATFPARPASVPAARQFVASTLATWKMADCDEPARLAVSELVTNALIHATGDIEVTVRRAGSAVRIEVVDGSAATPVRRQPDVAATDGRGILVVESVADDWGYEPTAGGKRVWFELRGRAAGGHRIAPA